MSLKPRGIREHLGLNKPIYARTSAYGHFGREPDSEGGFSWEKTDLAEKLKSGCLIFPQSVRHAGCPLPPSSPPKPPCGGKLVFTFAMTEPEQRSNRIGSGASFMAAARDRSFQRIRPSCAERC